MQEYTHTHTHTHTSNLPNQSIGKTKGITLIALAITIIVLLILTGVTISALTGKTSLLNKADLATEENGKQTATEKMNLKITNIQIGSYAEKQQMPTLQELANALCEDEEMEYVITKEDDVATTYPLPYIDTNGHHSIFTKLNEYPYEFEIDESLRLASVNGMKAGSEDESIGELKREIEEMKLQIKTLQEEKAREYKMEELFTGKLSSTEDTGALKQSANNYNLLVVTCRWGGLGIQNFIIFPQDIGKTHVAARYADSATTHYCRLVFTINQNEIVLNNVYSNIVVGSIERVVGIKF